MQPLTTAQIQQFKIDGYLVLPGLLGVSNADKLLNVAEEHLSREVEPYELEADVAYPGAPASRDAQGGKTIRRLLHAHDRDELLRATARNAIIVDGIKEILDVGDLYINPNHHNCIMTKQPAYSSETLWHRDTRYWNFTDKYLINAWFPLRDEHQANGAIKVLPGSHRWEVPSEALDEHQFLKLNHEYNQDRLATQRVVELNVGDALLFSAHTFHAAGKNQSDKTKFSLVYTYHGPDTLAIENTRSAVYPPIPINSRD
ncbi:MAG: phytanoyl-CoA hydroxylase [Gammaproteobacteria bacterium]|jgi:phytanoyl-CoA hydroxylase